MTWPKVCAVIVTRGNVDLDLVLDSIPDGWAIEVWNNSIELHDLSVYGRYAAIERTDADLIYVQDDDCIVSDPAELVRWWQQPSLPDGKSLGVGHVVCNMPEPFRAHYTDSGLVGFGAVFARGLPAAAFERYRSTPVPNGGNLGGSSLYTIPDMGQTGIACRECDAIFTTLTPMVWVDVPVKHLPWATAPDRLYRQPEHGAARRQILALARQVRDLG